MFRAMFSLIIVSILTVITVKTLLMMSENISRNM